MTQKPYRVLLLPYGSWVGKDVGLHEGFEALLTKGAITDVRYIYYNVLAKEKGFEAAKTEILRIALDYRPHIIIWGHIESFPVTHSFIRSLKNIDSKPTFVYDDGDAYGSMHKPVKKSMRLIMDEAHLISIRGLGDFGKMMARRCPEKVIYTPNVADKKRFVRDWTPARERRFDIIMIGNRISKRVTLLNRIPWMRMPGVYQREQIVRRLGSIFGDRFAVYGRGWKGFIGNQGPIPFLEQINVIHDSWISIGYDHYPGIPFYHSDRLPVALMSGVAHVSNYHQGYEHMFRNMEHLVWFHTVDEAVDVVRFMFSRGPDWLIELGLRGQEYALRWLSAERVWLSLFDRIVQFRVRTASIRLR